MPQVKGKRVLTPVQRKGAKTGARVSVNAGSRAQAVAIFSDAKARMLDINNWDKLCGPGTAAFKLVNKSGRVVNRTPRIGDFIRIDLPGPGPRSGKGYDWVRIEEFVDDEDPFGEEEYFGFRTRPAKAPSLKENDTAHFYTSEATSSFILHRSGNKISAAERGSNEIPNTGTKRIRDKVRNASVAFGAMLGISSVQWRSLMKGILGTR
jgi:hypothetical protein